MPLLEKCGGCLLAVKILAQALRDIPKPAWHHVREIASFLSNPDYLDRSRTGFQIISLSLMCILDNAKDQSRVRAIQQRMQALEGLALFQSSVSLPSGVLWLAFRVLNKGQVPTLMEYESILGALKKSNLLMVSSATARQCKPCNTVTP